MKKFLSLALIAAMLLSCVVLFGSCDKAGSDDEFKLGVICLHDEDSTYDLNFINGVKEAQKALGLRDDQVIIKRNIPESNACYEAALDLVDEGCDVIFANSFGHETHILAAAKDALAHTPDQLPVLKKAGVVDAGGMGFLVILKGMLDELRGIPMPEGAEAAPAQKEKADFASFETGEITFGYCTEFIVNKAKDAPSAEKLRALRKLYPDMPYQYGVED